MHLSDLLTRYGQYSECGDHTVNIHVRDPARLTKTADIAYYDKWAAESMQLLEGYLEGLREYRTALAKRYGELVTMPYTLRIDAQRRRNSWGDKKVTYHVCITKVFEDGTEQSDQWENFPGTERRAFYKRLAELEKQYPNADHKYSLEKSRWER